MKVHRFIPRQYIEIRAGGEKPQISENKFIVYND